jgi:hypothetical protein
VSESVWWSTSLCIPLELMLTLVGGGGGSRVHEGGERGVVGGHWADYRARRAGPTAVTLCFMTMTVSDRDSTPRPSA